MSQLEDLPPVLKVSEAAEALRMCNATVYGLITEGRLRATNTTRGKKQSYRILREDLISFIRGDVNQGKGPTVAT